MTADIENRTKTKKTRSVAKNFPQLPLTSRSLTYKLKWEMLLAVRLNVSSELKEIERPVERKCQIEKQGKREEGKGIKRAYIFKKRIQTVGRLMIER